MKTLLAALFTLALVSTAHAATITGYYESDKVSGMNRICFYKTIRGTMSHTIKANEICPLSKQFNV